MQASKQKFVTLVSVFSNTEKAKGLLVPSTEPVKLRDEEQAF